MAVAKKIKIFSDAYDSDVYDSSSTSGGGASDEDSDASWMPSN